MPILTSTVVRVKAIHLNTLSRLEVKLLRIDFICFNQYIFEDKLSGVRG